MLAQGREISGTVTSAENGDPLPGVNVIIKGTTQGTVTNSAGAYNLQVPRSEAILVFSFVGFLNQEIPVGDQTTINAVMNADIQTLGDLVVIGYGEQERRDVTSAISTIPEEEIKRQPVISLDQALQGQAAGVQITNNTGAPGSGVQVRIRGTSSIFGGNEPLYVVDGVPITNTLTGSDAGGNDLVNGLAGINPSDIESIEVLKDAAAAAIYGARAANGVVLITTRRGKAGQGRLTVDAYTGFQSFNNFYDLLDAPAFAELVNEGRTYINEPPAFTETPTFTTNWQEEIFQRAPISSFNIGYSGGSEKVRYAFTAGYFDQEGVVIGSGFDRLSFRSNVDFDLSDKFTAGVNLTLSSADNNRIRNNGNANPQDNSNQNNIYGPNVVSSALVANPAIPIFNPDGSFGVDSLSLTSNPLALATETDLASNTFRMIG
ncbi:MAG: SusC/RagA family TonB-linked outer membrane protein, partial [Bacteroidia bacterium]|nr:SusC/RagA family TonB-linked outer membrane protein [Bacteroidia bacterium]